jgi:hypothetical protein
VLDFGVNAGHLNKRYLQRFVRQISIFNINAGRYRPNIARFKLRQKIGRKNVCASSLVVQKHRQIEVEIDDALAVKLCDSIFG